MQQSLSRFTIALVLLSWAFSSQGAWAAKKTSLLQATAQRFVSDGNATVVWVSAVVRIQVSSGGRSFPAREQRLETLGTIVGKDGLTVVSNSMIDPTASIRKQLRSGSARVNVEFQEVRILLDDGSEIPAKLALKDPDLDIAFVMPLPGSEELKSAALRPVNLRSKATPAILDEVLVLGKLGRTLYRQPTVGVARVNSVIEKPRRYYILSRAMPGSPVFDARGRLLGIAVYKIAGGVPTTMVTLPSEDVLEIAQQARERAKDKK
ncbi:MAG: serine protease [Opitutales bacterium]